MPTRTMKQIHNLILEKDNFLLVAHQNPDGDCLGSVTALSQMLKNIGKKYTIFCLSDVPPQYNFLHNIGSVSKDPHIWDNSYELIIVCDSGDFEYAGVETFLKDKTNIPPIINIDHHVSNKNFGTYNIVDTTASSTTEVLFHYMKHNEISIDRHIATSLLTGLITDTGNFSNSGTSKQALTIASILVKKGAMLNHIRTNVLTDKKIPTFKLWGLILARLARNPQFDISYTYITKDDLEKCGVDEEAADGISNLMNGLKEGKATFVLREKDGGTFKVSGRTTRDDIDLSQIAQSFGGGGHKKAAGFTIQGPIDNALQMIWSKLEELV